MFHTIESLNELRKQRSQNLKMINKGIVVIKINTWCRETSASFYIYVRTRVYREVIMFQSVEFYMKD